MNNDKKAELIKKLADVLKPTKVSIYSLSESEAKEKFFKMITFVQQVREAQKKDKKDRRKLEAQLDKALAHYSTYNKQRNIFN